MQGIGLLMQPSITPYKISPQRYSINQSINLFCKTVIFSFHVISHPLFTTLSSLSLPIYNPFQFQLHITHTATALEKLLLSLALSRTAGCSKEDSVSQSTSEKRPLTVLRTWCVKTCFCRVIHGSGHTSLHLFSGGGSCMVKP